MARKKGSTDYPLEVKLEAIRLWEEEGLPYKEITARLEIRDPNRVRNWMRLYRQEGRAGLQKPRRGRPKKDRGDLDERIRQLEMENALLKALALGVSRSAYYAWVKRMDRPDPDQERMQLVREAYEASRKTYGYRRVQIWIEREHGININHKCVFRLMRKLHIRSIARKRHPYRQIRNRYGRIYTYPNLMSQNFMARRPNEKWGTDITYIHTQQGFVYLAIVKDFFDGTILGHAMSRNLSVHMVSKALQAAASSSLSIQGVILQSDQGSQFQTDAYHTLISKLGIVPSMSRAGNCLDNAPTENFFSHLKEEFVRHIRIRDFQEAVRFVDDYIHFYNHDRIQLKTKLTPIEFRRQFV